MRHATEVDDSRFDNETVPEHSPDQICSWGLELGRFTGLSCQTYRVTCPWHKGASIWSGPYLDM